MKYSNYCGNENVAFIYFNEWADPKVEYKGFQWSSWEVEDALRDDFAESGLPDTESHFVAYVAANVEELLTDWLYALDYFGIEFIRENAPDHFELLRDNIAYGIGTEEEYTGWRFVTDAEVLERYAGVRFVVSDFVNLA